MTKRKIKTLFIIGNGFDCWQNLPTSYQNEDAFPVHQKLMPRDINGYLGKPTIFLAEQICTIDKKQVLCKVGHVDKKSEAISKIMEIFSWMLSCKNIPLQIIQLQQHHAEHFFLIGCGSSCTLCVNSS